MHWLKRIRDRIIPPPDQRAVMAICRHGRTVIPMNPKSAASISAFIDAFEREECVEIVDWGIRIPKGDRP